MKPIMKFILSILETADELLQEEIDKGNNNCNLVGSKTSVKNAIANIIEGYGTKSKEDS